MAILPFSLLFTLHDISTFHPSSLSLTFTIKKGGVSSVTTSYRLTFVQSLSQSMLTQTAEPCVRPSFTKASLRYFPSAILDNR